MRNQKKKRTALVLGIFLTGMSYTFGQVSNSPLNRTMTLDNTNRALYEHGYNKDNTSTPDSPRENTDTVMVTSVMNYFVMPHDYYNKDYFDNASDYTETNLTNSMFDWSSFSPGRGTIVPQNSNSTGTSPWVKVTWNTAGIDTLHVKEVPQVATTLACESDTTKIPVLVIPKPTIGFTQVGTPPAYAASDCYDAVTVLTASYDFPFTVTTSSSQVWINYTIVETDLMTGTVSSTTVQTDVPITLTLVSGTTYTATLNLPFTDYGIYEVTINEITDRIARKCEIVGDINSGAGVFTYSVLPQPQPGRVFHVPNNF